MPYAPGIQPRGDQYLFSGISQLGQGLGEAVRNFVKSKRESDFLDKQMVGLAAAMKPMIDSGEIDPEIVSDMEKFPGMSLAQKRGAAASYLFQIQSAKEARAERASAEDRTARRSMEHGRLQMEAARFNQQSQERATEQAGKDQFNAGLADYLQIPDGIRRPAREAVPELAARAGVATPDMAYRMEDARLRDAELGIRDRAVSVQERNAGVSEGKLGIAEEGAGKMKPEVVQRMMNEVLLRLSDPLKSPDAPMERMLRQRLKDLQGMLPSELQGDPAQAEEGKKPLDAETAKSFLKKAGGDKTKARQMAKDAGYEF